MRYEEFGNQDEEKICDHTICTTKQKTNISVCTFRREEQLNDLIDSQQKEISQMKLELRSLEDKMTYHSNEQARDTEVILFLIVLL